MFDEQTHLKGLTQVRAQSLQVRVLVKRDD